MSRIEEEVALLKTRFPDAEYRPDGRWGRVPSYDLPSGWGPSSIQLAFLVPVEYPGAPPYGIYVPSGMRFGGRTPNNYTDTAPAQPPFGGTWGLFSWTTQDGLWHPAADVRKGSNLLHWVLGFRRRFEEGA